LNVEGDYLNGDESSLIILNHRTRVDWNFFWAASFHGFFPQNPNTKIVLKKEIRKYPWIGRLIEKKLFLKRLNFSDLFYLYIFCHLLPKGWSLQCARHIFISRNWKRDEITMEEMLQYHSKIQVDLSLKSIHCLFSLYRY